MLHRCAVANRSTIGRRIRACWSQSLQRRPLHTDVLVVGGGVVGCALANCLRQQQNSNLVIGVLEAGKGPSLASLNDNPPKPHPRSYALSPASLQLLGLDQAAAEAMTTSSNNNHSRLGVYDSMQVWEAQQPAALIFHAQDYANNDQTPYLGAVVEDHTLLQHLWPRLQDDEQCHVVTQRRVQAIHVADNKVHVTMATDDNNATTETWTTRLLVGADGANSGVRRIMGMARSVHDYGQMALTCTVALAPGTTHRRRAYQRFTSDGSTVAVLPTFDPHYGILVWSTDAAQAALWKDKSAAELCIHINTLLHDGPARLPPLLESFLPSTTSTALRNLVYGMDKVVEVAQYGPSLLASQMGGRHFWPTPTLVDVTSPRFTFPLSTAQVHHYTAGGRVALVGDAAHTMHPMAGQGLNLGLQDVADLAQVITKAAASGMDVATFLDEYERTRKVQCSLTLSAIHTLHSTFGIQHTVAKHIKALGMNAIQNIPPLRRAVVQVACQGVATK